MSEDRHRCARIERSLLERSSEEMPPDWRDHLHICDECREQVSIHERLEAFFAAEDVPELSAEFDAALERKLRAARVEVRPLAGWGKVAMIAYATGATGVLAWTLKSVALSTIDFSAPWVPVAAFLAVPLSLLLAAAASRWLPGPDPTSQQKALAL